MLLNIIARKSIATALSKEAEKLKSNIENMRKMIADKEMEGVTFKPELIKPPRSVIRRLRGKKNQNLK